MYFHQHTEEQSALSNSISESSYNVWRPDLHIWRENQTLNLKFLKKRSYNLSYQDK